jgi:hypothetical protein
MFEQVIDVLKVAGALFLFTAIWLITIAVVFRDIQRRKLRGIEQFLWLAATALLPLVGFLIYWVARLLSRILLLEEKPGEDPRLRLTMARPPVFQQRAEHSAQAQARPLPTLQANEVRGGVEPGASTMPALDPWADQPPGQGAHMALVVLDGPHTGAKFPLHQLPARIGRGTSVAVPLNADQGISRQHAEIYSSNGQVRIRDLNSTHGTYVNGQRAGDALLRPGDRVQVGVSTFLIAVQ